MTAKVKSRYQTILTTIILCFPLIYLTLIPVIQLSLIRNYFGTVISTDTLIYIYSSHGFLYLGFAGSVLFFRNRKISFALTGNWEKSLERILLILLVACVAYVSVAILRIYLRWDVFSLPPTEVRQTLQVTRQSVTLIGIFNAALHAAPTMLMLFLIPYISKFKNQNFVQFMGLFFFVIFVALMTMEGARLGVLISIILVIFAFIVSGIQRNQTKKVTVLFLTATIVLSVLSMVSSYRGFTEREKVLGRSNIVESREGLVRTFGLNDPNEYYDIEAKSRPPSIKDPQKPSIGTSTTPPFRQNLLLICFYISHPIHSINLILEKNADLNLYGVLTFSHAYKLMVTSWNTVNNVDQTLKYYGVLGRYIGWTGTILIEFGVWGALVAHLISGLVFGYIVSLALRPGGLNSPFYVFVPLVLAIILCLPIVNVITSSLGQSLLIWLGVVFLAMILQVGNKFKLIER